MGCHSCTLSDSGLFGEDPANRRERLRELLSARLERGEMLEAVEEAAVAATAVGIHPRHVTVLSCCVLQIDEGVWFHEGPEQLLNARYWIADYSIPRSAGEPQRGDGGEGGRGVELRIVCML